MYNKYMITANTTILFLDIDGVIREHKQDNPNYFTPECVECFNRILSSNEIEIVLSSAWKSEFPDLMDCQKFFKEQGIIQYPLSYTPNAHSFNFYVNSDPSEERTIEILEWVRVHNPRNRMKWIAIDDCRLYKSAQSFMNNEFNMLPYFNQNNFVETTNSICDFGIEKEINTKIKQLHNKI